MSLIRHTECILDDIFDCKSECPRKMLHSFSPGVCHPHVPPCLPAFVQAAVAVRRRDPSGQDVAVAAPLDQHRTRGGGGGGAVHADAAGIVPPETDQ